MTEARRATAPRSPATVTQPRRTTPVRPPASTPKSAARPWAGLRRRFALAPLLALVMVMAIMIVISQQRLSQEQDRVDRLERENAAITANLVLMQASGPGQGDNARWYPLLSVNESFADAGGVVLGDPTQSTAVLSVWNMPDSIGPFHIICESRLGELLAAGELQVNDVGVGTITLNFPGPMTEYRVVHIVHADDLPDGTDPRTQDVLLVRLEEPTVTPNID